FFTPTSTLSSSSRKLTSIGLPPIPPCALISSIAKSAPLRMNSPYPPSGPERIVWQPILIGFFRFSFGAARARGAMPRPAKANAEALRKPRRVVLERVDIEGLLKRGLPRSVRDVNVKSRDRLTVLESAP